MPQARRRVRAVSTVHSRLYRGDSVATVDLGRYIGELVTDLGGSMGPDWAAAIQTDLAPVCVDAGRAVTLGLILSFHWNTAASATMALVPIVLFFAVLAVQGRIGLMGSTLLAAAIYYLLASHLA